MCWQSRSNRSGRPKVSASRNHTRVSGIRSRPHDIDACFQKQTATGGPNRVESGLVGPIRRPPGSSLHLPNALGIRRILIGISSLDAARTAPPALDPTLRILPSNPDGLIHEPASPHQSHVRCGMHRVGGARERCGRSGRRRRKRPEGQLAADSHTIPRSPRLLTRARKQSARSACRPGLKVELFAAEPLLANPVAFCIDEKGRCLRRRNLPAQRRRDRHAQPHGLARRRHGLPDRGRPRRHVQEIPGQQVRVVSRAARARQARGRSRRRRPG